MLVCYQEKKKPNQSGVVETKFLIGASKISTRIVCQFPRKLALREISLILEH